MGLGSFIAACVLWSRGYDSLIGIGFAVFFGGLLFALTGYFFFGCIVEMTENRSVYVANYSEDRIRKMLEDTLAKSMSGVQVRTDERTQEEDIAENLPQI